MKRIRFSSGSVVTGDAVAAALVEYITSVSTTEGSVPVEIPVLGDDGQTSVSTLVVGADTQIEVSAEDDLHVDHETERFPVPELPSIGLAATVESGPHAERTADDIDAMMADIDEGLGQ
ncbi:hypothetical protein OVN20_10570 [Microcella daejeonensis]|uniref:hypothetical protein n=1 Tax=Microcella daejeonensis TaxID=2994971 RepID=UPI002271D589|nr:hypothetical protein [Microcella daejeonensis]WAB83495.1 hypothetical protein OVN20_10570 [Microcella daejeonensis]